MELPLPSLFCDREKQGGTELGDDTWAPVGSDFCRVLVCWRAGTWGPVAVVASVAGRRAGVSSTLAGLLDWPRELGRSAAARAS